jgi:hypothetical protein
MSTVNWEIQRIDEKIKKYQRIQTFLTLHAEAIDRLGLHPQCFAADHLDFNNPNREATLAALQLFGGNWNKELCHDATINYVQKIDGFTLRLYGAAPPPSCRLEEFEEIIPAQPERREKRLKLVCDDKETI